MRKTFLLLAPCLAFLFLCSCASQCPLNAPCPAAAPAPPASAPKHARPYRIHVVRKGDTLWHISKMYQVSMQDLIAVNHLSDPSHLIAGSRLIIPSRAYTHPIKASFSPEQANPTQREGFIWPVKGKIITYFGKSKRRVSKGIVIQAPSGTPVRATKSGKVIYSGWYGPFGHTVIIQHTGGYSSVYAHNQKNFVKVGQWVSQGQVIASVGQTGHTSKPCLEFEIRKKNQAVDPLIFLRSQ